MIKKSKRLIVGLFSWLLTIVGGFVVSGCSIEAQNNISYISSLTDFNLMFQTQKVIYIDDLDFNSDTTLEVNRSIKFVGKTDKSILKKVFINITAPNISGERIRVEFENIIFDGGFDKTGIDLTQENSFSNILGNRDNKHCISASSGYYDLDINNCEFTNYASENGSVIFVENNSIISPEDKVINLNNSKFYNNICQRGTLNIFSDKTKTTITNCEFYGNYGAIGTGFNICNGKLIADNCVIKDNHFCEFNINSVSGQDAGGGIHLGGVSGKMSNTKILNNKSIFGGGISVASKDKGDSSFVLENCEIKGNTAIKNGGGVLINSLLGQTVSFIGCEISFNEAPSSAGVCQITMGGWKPTIKSGNVNFFFCTIAMNEGIDNKGIITDLDFYVPFNPTKLPDQSQKANTQVKGSIIIDKTTLTANENDYNYIASPTEADLDGVIDLTRINNSADKQLYFLDCDKINVEIPVSIYSLWHIEFADAHASVRMGAYSQPNARGNISVLIISIVAVAIVALAVSVIIVVIRNDKNSNLEQSVAEQGKHNKLDNILETTEKGQSNGKVEDKDNKEIVEENKEKRDIIEGVLYSPNEIEQIMQNWTLIERLTRKEKEVLRYRLAGEKRKDIAKIQYVSENTVKKQLVSINTKLEIANKKDLMETAKQYINK